MKFSQKTENNRLDQDNPWNFPSTHILNAFHKNTMEIDTFDDDLAIEYAFSNVEPGQNNFWDDLWLNHAIESENIWTIPTTEDPDLNIENKEDKNGKFLIPKIHSSKNFVLCSQNLIGHIIHFLTPKDIALVSSVNKILLDSINHISLTKESTLFQEYQIAAKPRKVLWIAPDEFPVVHTTDELHLPSVFNATSFKYRDVLILEKFIALNKRLIDSESNRKNKINLANNIFCVLVFLSSLLCIHSITFDNQEITIVINPKKVTRFLFLNLFAFFPVNLFAYRPFSINPMFNYESLHSFLVRQIINFYGKTSFEKNEQMLVDFIENNVSANPPPLPGDATPFIDLGYQEEIVSEDGAEVTQFFRTNFSVGFAQNLYISRLTAQEVSQLASSNIDSDDIKHKFSTRILNRH